jgi:hypothetical protein
VIFGKLVNVLIAKFRTKIDWLMPTVIKADKLVTGIAQLS